MQVRVGVASKVSQLLDFLLRLLVFELCHVDRDLTCRRVHHAIGLLLAVGVCFAELKLRRVRLALVEELSKVIKVPQK